MFGLRFNEAKIWGWNGVLSAETYLFVLAVWFLGEDRSIIWGMTGRLGMGSYRCRENSNVSQLVSDCIKWYGINMIINKHVQKSSNIKYSNINFDMEPVTQATSFTMPNTHWVTKSLRCPGPSEDLLCRHSAAESPCDASGCFHLQHLRHGSDQPADQPWRTSPGTSPNHQRSNVAIYSIDVVVICCYIETCL